MNRNQNGFSTVHIIVIAIIVGILLFVGLRVRDANRSNVPQISVSQSSEHATAKTLPAGYSTYTNTKAGFSVSYPSEWGNMSSTLSAGTTLATTPPLQNIKFAPNQSSATLNGSFAIKIAPKAGFQIRTGKYGAILEASQEQGVYVWKVISTNPADTTDSVGSIYKAKVITTANDIKLYDFSNGDEGTFESVWVLEKSDNFIVIGLPNMESPDTFLGGPNAQSDAAAYANLSTTIANTITN